MIGLRYFHETCLQESLNPLNLVASSEDDTELKQISDKLTGNRILVASNHKIKTVIECNLTRDHTSVDLIGHGGGSNIAIGLWDSNDSDRFDAVASAMKKKGNTLLRLLACKQAFLPSAREELSRIATDRLSKHGVNLGVAGGYVVADQFDAKLLRFSADACNTIKILPKFLHILFAGFSPPDPSSGQSIPDWFAVSEEAALASCLRDGLPTVAVDVSDSRRILALPRVALSRVVGSAAFAMVLPSAHGPGVLVAHGYLGEAEVALLVPRRRDGTTTDYALELRSPGNTYLLNKHTVAVYWH